jgi:hypothetical protein
MNRLAGYTLSCERWKRIVVWDRSSMQLILCPSLRGRLQLPFNPLHAR